MTANEIKAAWNTFKRNAKKELSFNPCTFSMTVKQIANSTATICLCSNVSYEEDIDSWRRELEWRKKNWSEVNEEYYQQRIRFVEELREKYGSIEGEAVAKYDEIIHSKAFSKLAEAIGITATTLEAQGYSYYLRISY